MLKDADNRAKPTKYAQNKRQGMYGGTASMMNLAPERCSAPKTAKGMAKHKLLRTTILSRPPVRAISVFAAHSATKKSRMPALHIATAVREISKNVARMVVCISTPSLAQCSILGSRSPGSIRAHHRGNRGASKAVFNLKWSADDHIFLLLPLLFLADVLTPAKK